MNNSNYYITYYWMKTELHLKGNEKEAYAIIYSYYRSGIAEVNASLKYFADAMDCTERTASTVLANLVKKGLISKTTVRGRDGGLRNTYRVNYQILVDKGIITEYDDEKAEKPKNFTPETKKFPVATGKNFSTLPEKISDNNTNIYNNNSYNPSFSFYSEKSEEKKKEEKEITKKMSYQEVLQEIGVSSNFITSFNVRNENSLEEVDSEEREAGLCEIPYSFKGNKKAVEYALKYMTCYSYNKACPYAYNYNEYADMIIPCMAELASDETTRIKGGIVKYYQVIDRLNEINTDGRGLEEWINKFPIFWKKILKEKEQNGEKIRYKKAFMKACIWDYMNRPYGLW